MKKPQDIVPRRLQIDGQTYTTDFWISFFMEISKTSFLNWRRHGWGHEGKPTRCKIRQLMWKSSSVKASGNGWRCGFLFFLSFLENTTEKRNYCVNMWRRTSREEHFHNLYCLTQYSLPQIFHQVHKPFIYIWLAFSRKIKVLILIFQTKSLNFTSLHFMSLFMEHNIIKL